MPRATDAQVRQWQEDGWVLLPELVPRAEIEAAEDDLQLLFPDLADLHARRHDGDGDPEPRFRLEQFLGLRRFPFPGSGALNRLAVHDHLVDFAERALQSMALRIYQMSVWAKCTGAADYEQPMHQDHNHSVVPPRPEPGWWHVEGFLYLSDVDDGVAPTRVVSVGDSGGRLRVEPLARADAPDLYERERSAAGPKGSYLAYRPDVFHRGVDLTRPGGERFLYNLSYKLAGQDWIGYDNVQPLSTTGGFVRFVEGCAPRQLALFGVPEPGHPYWTASTLAAMAERYPNLDLTPWRQAIGAGPEGAPR